RTTAGNSNFTVVAGARRYADVDGLLRVAKPDGQLPHCSAMHVFQGQRELRFRFCSPGPAARTRAPSSLGATHTTHSCHSAEKRLKKITERSATPFLCAAEEVFHVDGAPESTTAWPTPIGRRSEIGSVLPVGSQLIVFLTLLLVAEDFVGFLDFFEFLFSLFVVRVQVRMILAG